MLALASDAKDTDTGNHIQRVRFYSESLATKLGFSSNEAEEVGYSSMMHDIGKIAIPDNILKKPGKLHLMVLCLTSLNFFYFLNVVFFVFLNSLNQ